MKQQTTLCANGIVHDADSHIIASDGWMKDYASQYLKDNRDKASIVLEILGNRTKCQVLEQRDKVDSLMEKQNAR